MLNIEDLETLIALVEPDSKIKTKLEIMLDQANFNKEVQEKSLEIRKRIADLEPKA